MTLTKTTDCASIVLANDLLEDFKNSTNDVTGVILYSTYNGSTEGEWALSVDDVTDGTITLLPEFFSQETENLQDGIYCFRIVVTQDTNEITEYGNILIDCGLICTLAEYVWNNPTKQLHAKYEAIKYYQQCNNCDCTTVYALYQDLLIDLGMDTTSNDCGC